MDFRADRECWHLNCYYRVLLGLLPVKPSPVDWRSGSGNERLNRSSRFANAQR